MNDLLSEIKFITSSDVNEELIYNFYNEFYPLKNGFLSTHWKWFYRIDFLNNSHPILILHKNKIIGHAALIPFKVAINSTTYIASWFVDFSVLKEYRRYGLGMELVKRWSNLSDIHLALTCNKISLKVFLKSGWKRSSKTFLLTFPIDLSKHPAIIRNCNSKLREIIGLLTIPFYKWIYSIYKLKPGFYTVENVEINSLNSFLISMNNDYSKNKVNPVRDWDYLKWRILTSPEISKYRIVTYKKYKVLIKYCDDHYSKYIDILLTNNGLIKNYLKNIIATISLLDHSNYYFIRYYTNKAFNARYLQFSLLPFVQKPRFCFNSDNKNLLNEIEKYNWDWQLIDNDFERFSNI